MVFWVRGCFVLSSLLVAISSQALELTPIEMTLEPEGRRSQGTFQVVNTQAHTVAVQVRIYSRLQDLDGNETRVLSNDFSFFPPQLRLEPKQARALKVTWRGAKSFDTEKAYRMIVEQLPVDFKKKQQRAEPGLNLQFLMKFVASVYVAPPLARPQIRVASSAVTTTTGGAFTLEVVLHNEGRRHLVLRNARLTEKGPLGTSQKLDLPDSTFAALQGQNLLAGQKRRFVLPLSTAAAKMEAVKDLAKESAKKLEVHFD